MPKTVLTIDDSPTVRQMVKLTLGSAGYAVIEAGSGTDALSLAQSRTADVIITDLNMPGLDGIAVIKRLRALPAYRFTPILMLTTESQPEKKLAGKQAGATGWVVKPFSPEQLVAVISRVCPP